MSVQILQEVDTKTELRVQETGVGGAVKSWIIRGWTARLSEESLQIILTPMNEDGEGRSMVYKENSVCAGAQTEFQWGAPVSRLLREFCIVQKWLGPVTSPVLCYWPGFPKRRWPQLKCCTNVEGAASGCSHLTALTDLSLVVVVVV